MTRLLVNIAGTPSFAKGQTDFIDGMHTMTSTGDARQHWEWPRISMRSMKAWQTVLLNADAEMMIVPELGEIALFTEMGRMPVPPGHIAGFPAA